MEDIFKRFISSISQPGDDDWNLISDKPSYKSFESGSYIYMPGDICEKMIFLNSGVIRSFFIDDDGKEFTWSFHFSLPQRKAKNTFIIDYASYLHNEPTKFHFEVLSRTSAVLIDKTTIEMLYAKSKYWEHIGRIIAEEVYYTTHNRTLSLLTQPASQRYLELMLQYPELTDLVPQQYIASYLGITPQSLSRIKNRT